jgi:flagellar biosynthetic protein FliR
LDALELMAPMVDDTQLVTMGLVLLRIATAAVLATSCAEMSGIPMRLRVGGAIVFSLLLVPLVPSHLSTTTLADFPALAVAEILCGALFGFGVRLWLVGAAVCSQLFGQTSGLGMVAFAQAGAGSAPLARFLQLVWICVFFVAGGHRLALECLMESFRATPPGGLVYDAQTLAATVELLGVNFRLGIQAGLPIVAALLLTVIVSLLLARMIPQIHVFSTSTGLTALMLVAALWIGCGPLFRSLEGQVGVFLSTLSKGVLGN